LSNLIKAYMINYDEKIKTLDSNQRADEFQQKYVDNYIAENIAPKPVTFESLSEELAAGGEKDTSGGGFSPGLFGERITLKDEASEVSEELQGIIEMNEAKLLEQEERLSQIENEAESILNEAREEVKRILNQAKEDAEEERRRIFSEAEQNGYESGMEKAREQERLMLEDIERMKQENQAAYERQVSEIEPAFVELLAGYVEKLTGILVEDRKEIILHIVHKALLGQPSFPGYLIRVSEEDYEFVTESKEKIVQWLPEDASLEIIGDKMLCKGQCMIETESRIFDCSLDMQLQSLIEDIRLLAEKD